MSDNDYGAISKIGKNAENIYYLVKRKIDGYNFYSYHKIGIDVIKDGQLVCDALYLDILDNFKQWYTHQEKNEGKTIFRFNIVILTKVKVQSINSISLTNISSNKFRRDSIRLGDVHVCYDTHYEILETILSREESHYNEFILER